MPETASKKKIIASFILLLVVLACVGGYLYYVNNNSILTTAQLESLIDSNQSAKLHEIADSNPAKVGRSNWILANLYVADEFYIYKSADSSSSSKEIDTADAAGLVNVAKVLTVNNTNPAPEDVLAWVVLAEKLRRTNFNDFTTHVVPANAEVAAAYQKTLQTYSANTTSDKVAESAIPFFIGQQIHQLYLKIQNDPAYSSGLKEDLIQTLSFLVLLDRSNLNNPTFTSYKNDIFKLFYPKVWNSPDTLSIVPEYKLIGEGIYLTSIYSLKKAWNIDTLYYWQQNHTVVKDYASNLAIPFALVKQTNMNSIQYNEELYKNAKNPTELGIYNSNSLRVSLALLAALATTKKDQLSVSDGKALVADLFKPLVSLYNTDPENSFFAYLKSIKNTADSTEIATLKALLSENKPASDLLVKLGW